MQEPRVVHIGNLSLANNQKIKLIAGPCALESKEHAFEMAGALTELAKTFGIGLIYKTSYDKANRTSFDAKRGNHCCCFYGYEPTFGYPSRSGSFISGFYH